MAQQTHSFKVNIRLKDIIGQGLINNSNIAIIELIKNARDANSKKVNIFFENATNNSSSSRIIIQDFGNGMGMQDIIHKWLNIAYSERRNKTKGQEGFFAGDKGIGRFSCDRLGKILHIYTRKKNEKLIHLNVNWQDFEIDDRDKEISSVELNPEITSDKDFQTLTSLPSFTHGTCLVIQDLRGIWGEHELEKLKKELERFILDPHKEFEIYLKSSDLLNKEGKLIFDGKIKNKLLAKLDDKTISIHSQISDDGSLITTKLHYYGHTILSFEEKNTYSELQSINVQIHYLSQASKVSFKNITDYSSAEYGSIMFFLNGFRVMPYGEPKDDWLGLNQRKAQGTMRFLGTRELFGIIEANDNQRKFLPVSSREGLEDNLAFKQLTDSGSSSTPAYIPSLLRILERFVVQGIDWDRVSPRSGDFSLQESLNAMMSVLETHSKDNKLSKVKIDEDYIRKIAKQKIADYKDFVSDLTKRVSDKSVYELTPSDKKNVAKYILRHDSSLAQKNKTNEEYKQTVEVEKKRRLFAESHQTTDTQRVANLQHQVKILSEEIYDELESTIKDHSRGKTLKIDEVIKTIKSAFFNISKIKKLAQIITKANFDIISNSIRHDIFSYIEQYIIDICESGAGWGINVNFSNPKKLELELNMHPIELSMLVDNILDNAQKADAQNVIIQVSEDKKYYILEFSDDGKGLSRKFKPEDYFKAGITTTNGSGTGLNHVQMIVKDLEGEVSIKNNETRGASILIRWTK